MSGRSRSLDTVERPGWQFTELIPVIGCKGLSFRDGQSPGMHNDGCCVARGALVHLAREVGGQSLGAIANWIVYCSCAKASNATSRLRGTGRQKGDAHNRLKTARRELTKGRRS